MFRIGFGQDSHRFSSDKDRKLFLGGVEIPGEQGLEGNSDGDAVIHAICRALEQSIGSDSFSIYADKMSQEGISDSVEYLKKAVSNVKNSGYEINNVGISIEAKKPRISEICGQMKEKLADILQIEISGVGINATSGEELTAFGKGEGIQVFAIVSIRKKVN